MSTKIGILIDSASTFNPEYLKKNKIEVVPLSLSDLNNKVYADDGIQMTPTILFKEIENGNVFKTSCTPIGQLMLKVENMLKEYDVVIYLPISHGLSSQYNQAKMLEQEYPEKFFVIKSTSGGSAIEYVSYKLVDMIKQKLEPKEIVEKCEKLFSHTDTYFSCEDVSDLLRGGRISQGIIKVIKFLKLKPVVLLDVKNQQAGMGKSYQMNAQKMVRLIKEVYENKLTSNDIELLSIYYSGYEDEKKEYLLNLFSKEFNYDKNKIIFRWVPTVVLAHTRKGAYGISIGTKIAHKIRKFKEN